MIIVVGPDPEAKRSGGIVTHMQMLKKLRILRDSRFLTYPLGRSSLVERVIGEAQWLGVLIRYLLKDSDSAVVLLQMSVSPGSCLRAVCGSIAATALGANVGLFVHGGRISDLPKPIGYVLGLVLRIMTGSLRVYCLSDVQADEFRRYTGNNQVGRYQNFIDDPRKWPRSRHASGKVDVVYAGRLVAEKGVRTVIETMAQLRDEENARVVRLNVAGDGPLEDEVIAWSRDWDWINYMGYIEGEALERLYAESDVLLLPTQHPEGMPYVVIEALRGGCAIVATDQGAMRELVCSGENGWLVNSGAKSEIAGAVRCLLEEPTLLESFKEASRSRFEKRFSSEAGEKFYREIIAELRKLRSRADGSNVERVG